MVKNIRAKIRDLEQPGRVRFREECALDNVGIAEVRPLIGQVGLKIPQVVVFRFFARIQNRNSGFVLLVIEKTVYR